MEQQVNSAAVWAVVLTMPDGHGEGLLVGAHSPIEALRKAKHKVGGGILKRISKVTASLS